jgi:hypothetical protein
VTTDSSWPQAGGEQTTGVSLKDQQRVIHVLAISTIKEAELLLSVSGIVGGIDIQQDLSSLANLFPADFQKPIQQSILQSEQIARRRRVLPAAESWLRSEELTQRWLGQNLKSRIVPQAIGVVGILVARDNLVEALTKQRQHGMTNALLCTRITETQCQLASKTMPLIKGPQRQKTGVRTDLAPRKISSNGSVSVVGKQQL